jgi:hypothetical protein
MKTAQHAGGAQITAWDASRILSSAGGRPFLLSPSVTAHPARAFCLLALVFTALQSAHAYADDSNDSGGVIGAIAGALASAMDVSGGSDDDWRFNP